MMTRWREGILATAALAAFLNPGSARADSDELMPCLITIIKAPPAAGGNGMTKFVCKGAFALPSAAAAPAPLVSVDVNIDPPGNTGANVSTPCTGLGNPAGAKGYKCSVLPSVPVVLIKANLVKGVLKYDLPFLFYGNGHPFASDDVRIRVKTIGASDSKRYCARFTSPLKNDTTQYKSKTAPAPSACSPSGAFLAEEGGLF
jgi:hypothetical protein